MRDAVLFRMPRKCCSEMILQWSSVEEPASGRDLVSDTSLSVRPFIIFFFFLRLLSLVNVVTGDIFC